MTEYTVDQLIEGFKETSEYESLLTELPQPQIAYILNEFKSFVAHHPKPLLKWQHSDWTDFALFTQIRRQAKGRTTTVEQLHQILGPWGFYLINEGATKTPVAKFQLFLESLVPDPDPHNANGFPVDKVPKRPDLPEWQNATFTELLNDLQDWLKHYTGSEAGHKQENTSDDAYLPIVEFVMGAYRFFRQTPAKLTTENVQKLMLNQYVTEALIDVDDVPRVLPLLTSFFEFMGQAGFLSKDQAMAILTGLAQVADDYPKAAVEQWRFSEEKQMQLQTKAAGTAPAPVDEEKRNDQAIEARKLLIGQDYDDEILELPPLADEPFARHVIHVEGTVWDYDMALSIHDVGLTNGVAVWLHNIADTSLDQKTVTAAVALATDWMYALYLERPNEWRVAHFAEMIEELSPDDRRIMKLYLEWSRADNQHTPEQIDAMLKVVESNPGGNVVSFEAEKRRREEEDK